MSTQPSSSFSSLLRHYRRAAGLTQEALAERALMSRRGIQNLEEGRSRTPRRDTLALLADALTLAAPERADLLIAAGRQLPAPASPARPAQAAFPARHDLFPFIGRDAELALLRQFLAGEGDLVGYRPLFLLAGEPGMGKSHLLEAAAQQAVAQGWRVLTGGCQRRGGEATYAPLLEALARHLQTLSPASRAAQLEGCARLVHLLPEMADVLEPLPPAQLPAAQERRLLFAAVGRFLAQVAGPAGTLLVLDDLQWADADALDLLASLVRSAGSGRAPGARVRVVGAYRTTEVAPTGPLHLLLTDLAPAGLVWQQDVGPLDVEAATTLLAHLLAGRVRDDPAVTRQVLERAGGTPYYLVSYAQALKKGEADTIPWDLAQAVRQRVALAPAAHAVLGAAAIIGKRTPRALLGAVMGQSDETLLAGLEAACQARLLLEDGDEAYLFAHDVIREVVEADLGAGRRAALHRRVAEALESARPPAAPERLAYHYGRAGVQVKVVEYLARAGDHALARYAYRSAEVHYRELVERLERLGRGEEALRAREQLSEALYRLGHYEGASEALGPVADAYRAAGEWERLGDAAARIGWMYSLGGMPHRGLALVRPLLEVLERRGPSPVLAVLYGTLGQLLYHAGDYEASLVANERAAALAATDAEGRTRVRAEYNRLVMCQALGRLGEALRLSREVLPLAEVVGHPNTLLGTLRDVAYMHALRGDLVASQEHMDRALSVARRMDDPGPMAYTLAQGGWIASLTGNWQGAHALIEEAVTLSQQANRSWYSSYPLIFKARLRLAKGDATGAGSAAREALTLARQAADLEGTRRAAGALAELEIREGQASVASARLEPLLDRPGLEECDVTVLLPALAWAHLEQGKVDQAADEVAQALVRARREGMRLVLVEALRVQALIALRQGRGHAAVRGLEEGLGLARAMPYPYAEARLLSVDGQRLATHGEPGPARERLEAALVVFRQLGARRDSERTEQMLASG